jgi:cell wall-associated NlpC family hydrolase
LAKFLLFYHAFSYANILKVENMLKNLLTILSLAVLVGSCSSLRSSASGSSTQSTKNQSIEFIHGISVKPDARQDKTGSSIETPAAFRDNNKGNSGADHPDYGANGGSMENFSALRFKYAILENAAVEDINNPKLLSFMDYWYGTRYRYGGTTREGIDCSAFAFLLLSSVYGVATMPRTAKEQYDASKRLRRDELEEGDLVFFHTLGKHKAVTHVGVYLRNNRFIHASVSGVMISDMNDGYYDKHYVGAGRLMDATASSAPSAAGSTSSRSSF